jgi:hypothetical protein
VTVLNHLLITREGGQAHTLKTSHKRAERLTASRDKRSPPRELTAYSCANKELPSPNFRANPFS